MGSLFSLTLAYFAMHTWDTWWSLWTPWMKDKLHSIEQVWKKFVAKKKVCHIINLEIHQQCHDTHNPYF
jgi:hypothetical protein